MKPAFAILALVGGASCSHALPAEVVEAAYLPKTRCQAGDRPCCNELVRAARASSDALATAHLWDEVALACPDRRSEATAAVAATTPVTGGLNVNYRTRLPPSYRLYWVATAIGPQLLPGNAPATGTQTLRVEVHAIRFQGARPGPLLLVDRRFDLPFDAGATVTVEIKEGGAAEPLAIEAQVEKVPVPRSRVQAPPRPTAAPRLEKARALAIAPPRPPREFGALFGASGPAVRLCLDREGQMDTVRFLEPAHPRVAASLIDMFRDARHEPYRVNDLPVPSCELMKRAGG
jgi:hypothetical protein